MQQWRNSSYLTATNIKSKIFTIFFPAIHGTMGIIGNDNKLNAIGKRLTNDNIDIDFHCKFNFIDRKLPFTCKLATITPLVPIEYYARILVIHLP